MNQEQERVFASIGTAKVEDSSAIELLRASRSILNADHSAWKQHGAKALARHGRVPIPVVTKWACETLWRTAAKVPMLERLVGETVPLYLALYEWAAAGHPHFTLCQDFFNAVAITDFGDPTDDPLYMPFHSFTVSFPKTAEFGFASRAFVYRVPSISQNWSVEWKLYRATLMIDRPILTQWPIGMTRAQLLNRDELLARLQTVDVFVPVAPARESTDAALVRTTLEINGLMRGLPVEEKQKLLENLTGAPGQRDVDGTMIYDSTAMMDRNDKPLNQVITAEQVPMTSALRLMLANVMSYIEAAGSLPTETRRRGAPPEAVERIHPLPIFEVGRVVKLDGNTRKALALGHGDVAKWKLLQKFMVRGHWRNQVHGVGRALRRRQWIAPFYKGPDNIVDALSRTYEVSG